MKTVTTLLSACLSAGWLLPVNASAGADAGDSFVEESYDESEADLHRSMTIVLAAEGEYSLGLVSTLNRLGNLYSHDHRYPEALAAMRRAQHITHRNDGVYTLDQLGIVKGISAVFRKTNRLRAADTQERFHYKINEYNFGADNEQMIPALTRLGDWFRHSAQFDNALKAYKNVVKLLERHRSEAKLELIAPLKAISSILYLQGSCCAVEPLNRVYDILADDPTADLYDRFRALLELADMSTLEGDHDRAATLYRRAWEMQESQNWAAVADRFAAPAPLAVRGIRDMVDAFRQARDGLRREIGIVEVLYVDNAGGSLDLVKSAGTSSPKEADRLIGSPLPLCYPQLLDLLRDKNGSRLEDYFMEIDFTVNRNGRVVAAKIVDSNTPNRLSGYVMLMLERTRFRPRISEGVPVSTDHNRLRETFAQDTDRDRRSSLEFESNALLLGCQMLTASNGV
jgi:tetratricopeptide (TPR) repeat protein